MATYYYADVRRYISERLFDVPMPSSLLAATPLASKDSTTVNTQFYIYFMVDVYSTDVSNFDTWRATSPLPGDLVSSTGAGGPPGFELNVSISKNTSDANIIQIGPANDNSHTIASFNRKGGAVSGTITCTPSVAIQWKSTDSPNWTNITNINWRTSDNTPPTFIWTSVVTSPTFPIKTITSGTPGNPVLDTITNRSANLKVTYYTWDKCISKWAYLVHDNNKNIDVLYYCGLNGDKITQVITGPSTKDTSTKANLTAWNLRNSNKYRESSTSQTCGDNTGGNQQDVTTPSPTIDARWNPPPHRDARSTSFFEKLKHREYENDKFNGALPAFAKYVRGSIYQDVNGAATLNKNPDKLKDLASAKGTGNLWGFRFMYNPTSFSYTTASNNSVDWTLGQSDPATLLAGNSNVTFEVYINRIPDLKYLRLTNPKATESTVYKRSLTQIERDGILNRGTEYDIEFLYRVLNGDPLQKSLLLNYNGVTADFGYTTGVPCWLVLNENLRYFGSVASFQVNHVMFDLNMVPMLSTVDITFSRYPALWNDTAAFGTGASASSIHNYLANTGKAPGK